MKFSNRVIVTLFSAMTVRAWLFGKKEAKLAEEAEKDVEKHASECEGSDACPDSANPSFYPFAKTDENKSKFMGFGGKDKVEFMGGKDDESKLFGGSGSKKADFFGGGSEKKLEHATVDKANLFGGDKDAKLFGMGSKADVNNDGAFAAEDEVPNPNHEDLSSQSEDE